MLSERLTGPAARLARMAILGLVVFALLQCERKGPSIFGRVGSPVGLIDVDAPLITGFLPVANVTLNGDFVMATITDPPGLNGATGVDPASITATGDDGADLPITMAGTNMYNADISMWGDGTHTINWSAFDFADNEGTGMQSIRIDRTPAAVTVSPAPPASATSDDASFSWTVGINIVEPNFAIGTYTVRFAGPDQECGTSDDVAPTSQQVPTSTFDLDEGANTVEVVANNGVAPGGQPMTAIYCGGIFVRDDAVTKTGGDASNTFTSSQYRTELMWQAPPSGSTIPGASEIPGTYTSTVTRTSFQGSCTPAIGGGTVTITSGLTIQNLDPLVAISGTYNPGTGVIFGTGSQTLGNGFTVSTTLNGTFSKDANQIEMQDEMVRQHTAPGGSPLVCTENYDVRLTRAITSSRRFKQDVVALLPGGADVFGLRPVSFRYRAPWGDPAIVRIGLVAEDLAQVFPEAVVRDARGRPEAILYPVVPRLVLEEVGGRLGRAFAAGIERLAGER